MSDSGFASLGPSLLARKGGAKPAMRPQVAPLVTNGSALREEQLEDLGWNDMGDSHLPGGAEIVPINADVANDGHIGSPGPIVRRQQRSLGARVLADAAMTGADNTDAEYDEDDSAIYGEAHDAGDHDEDEMDEDADTAIYSPLTPHIPVAASALAAAQHAPAKVRVSAAHVGRRAAFTLRLDADRHLKLRLAATMQGVSAQVLVTEALDRLLAEYDDLDIIAHHLKRH